MSDLSDAIYKLSAAALEVATLLVAREERARTGATAPETPARVPTPLAALPPVQGRPSASDEDEDVCPKHGEPYIDRGRGPFCPKLTDDPAWANQKGYCKITPSTAAQWRRIQAAGRAG